MRRSANIVARSAARPASVRTMATGKDLLFRTEARAKMLAGVQKLAKAVSVTLGPKGRTVVIEQSYGGPKSTKDGVSVAKAIEFADRFENIGAALVRQVASKTNDAAGDGTTTATVLTNAIYTEGCKAVAAGMNPMDLRRGIQAAVDRVLQDIKERTIKISTKDEIAQVATISANGEEAVGKLVAEAMERVGKEGVITVQDGQTLHDELEVVEGMRFDRGYLSPYFITDNKTQKVEFDDAYVMLVDGKISTLQPLLPALEAVFKTNKPLIIVAEDVEGDALGALIVNRLRGNFKVVAVKAPGFGDTRKAILQDMAVLTGGQVVNEEVGLKLEDYGVEHMGRAKRIVVSKDDTMVMGGAGSAAEIEERCNSIRQSMDITNSDYEREKLQERLAKLAGGVAVIKVGGASEMEVGEKRDRLDDALNATRAAVAEGIVPGGGLALLYATRTLNEVKVANQDQQVGVDIVRQALRAPATNIIRNAGFPAEVILGKLLENVQDSRSTQGFNAQTGEYVDMVKAGIIDPTKVVRTALVDAAGVASLMTTTEVMIVDLPKPESAPGDMPMGGMGGMGGMGF